MHGIDRAPNEAVGYLGMRTEACGEQVAPRKGETIRE